MRVLHANWSLRLGELLLWGEDSQLPFTGPSTPGERSGAVAPRPHPFACGTDTLEEALRALDFPPQPEDLLAEATLLLPAHQAGPCSSPRLLRGDGSAQAEAIGLAPWTVPALALRPDRALAFLLALPVENPSPQGLEVSRLGAELGVLAEVALLALEGVAQGQVAPTLELRGEDWMACWRPWQWQENCLDRLDRLSQALPALGRALLEPDLSQPEQQIRAAGWGEIPLPVATKILEDLLAALVDGLAREGLTGQRLAPARRGRRPKTVPAVEAWLEALVTPDGILEDGEDADLERLHRQLDTWLNPAPLRASGPFRCCFRLSPPDEDHDEASATDVHWQVDFLLQARHDPSLVVPVERVWETSRGALTILERQLHNPQEYLLAELGRASRLYPELETALHTAQPSALTLATQEAWRFLSEGAPLLEQAGFGVLVPPWWKKPDARLGMKVRAQSSSDSSTSSGLLTEQGICTFEWSVALGDEELSLDELRHLAALKVPLVRTRGHWVEVKPDEIGQALRFLEQQAGGGQATTVDLLRLGLGAAPSPAGLPVVALEAEGQLGELLTGRSRPRACKTPAGFKGKLRPYQQRGLSWLAFLGDHGLGACLADDMGLGKTIQLLALLVRERLPAQRKHAPVGPTLLVCPMSVAGNWQREAARFAPHLVVYVHHGSGRLNDRDLADQVAKTDLVITTYALVARDRDHLAELTWHRLVLDEAQNIKNSAARQTQAVRSFRASRRVALTGTPVENRLSELWSIMQFLNPGLLGSQRDFRQRFAVPVERYHDPDRAALLRRLCGPFILRRLKTDKRILRDLPEKLEIKVPCNLTREQATLYQAVVDDMLEKIASASGMERRGLVLATMLKLKQVCNHPAQLLQDRSALDGRSFKLTRLEEILEEVLAEGDRALVFTQFAQMGHLLREHLQQRFGREVLFLYGGTSKKERDRMVERFQGEDGPPIFLLSIKAGGTGLNLTAASHVIHFDRWWNPAVEDQATDRAFRIGQKQTVQVRKLVCMGTLEERIDQMIETKKALAEQVVGAGEGWLTELSTEELRTVIELSADTLAEEEA